MPFRVRDRLFIGDINYAAEVLQRGSTEVTHVLSLLSSASISFFSEWRSGVSIPTKEIRQGFFGESPSSSGDDGAQRRILYSLELAGPELKLVRMAVPLRDMENENLLDYLDVCLDFIDESRKEGGSVLVHCFAGVSRSAAVITAYLMRTERLSQEDALESLRQSCDAYNRGEKIDSSKFGADPGLSVEPVSNEAAPNANKPTPAYRCKKCRRVVALQENVINHIPGEGEKCFEWQKWRSGNPFNRSDELECSSIFVEPLQWMRTVEEGALEGKLLCAQCDARLGYFNWSGIQCSCGSWITPAFQLHKSRVDVSTL